MNRTDIKAIVRTAVGFAGVSHLVYVAAVAHKIVITHGGQAFEAMSYPDGTFSYQALDADASDGNSLVAYEVALSAEEFDRALSAWLSAFTI